MRCSSRIAALAAVYAAVVMAACAKPVVAGFAWKTADGASVAFRQVASWEAGAEGRFGPDRLANRYIPERPLVAGPGRCLELSVVAAEGARGALSLRLDLSSRSDGGKPFASARFPLRDRSSRFALPLPAGARIGAVAVTAEPATATAAPKKAGDGHETMFEILAIEDRPAFRGYRAEKDGTRVSSGFSYTIQNGESRLSIDEPFENPAADAIGAPRDERMRDALVLEYGAVPAGARIRVSATGDAGVEASYVLSCRLGSARLVFGPESFPDGAARVEARAPASAILRAFSVESIPEREAELADFGRVLRSKPANAGADYDLYRWDLLPSVLVFDFADYAVQDRYLKRLAFFVEKAGYRGSLQPDEVIGPLHGWNAHDYRPEDLAAFFRAARARKFPLNDQERALERLLVERGVLVERGGKIEPGAGAIISISRETPDYLRRTFIVHESTHALYFADPEYRSFVASAWKAMDDGEKWFWKRYFQWMVYDTGSDYLMANEYQAYLLQQPRSKTAEYFTKNLPANLLVPEVLAREPELGAKVEAYMAEYGDRFEERAAVLEAWLARKYGIAAGKTYFLE